MPGTRRRQPYEKVNFQQEVYLQVSIFLWTLFLMIILLAAFFSKCPSPHQPLSPPFYCPLHWFYA